MYGVPGSVPYLDPGEIRPRRRWYVIAALVAVVSAVVGGTVLVTGFWKAFPEVKAQSLDGSRAVAPLTADRTWGLWIATNRPVPVEVGCTVTDAGGAPVAIHRPSGETTFSRDGDEWAALYVFDVPRDGTYEFVCDDRDASTRYMYAVARYLDLDSVSGPVTVFALLLLGGFAAGGGMAIAVTVRRGRHRRSLLAWRAQTQPPYPPFPSAD